MKTKKPTKPYWEMTTAELREATKQLIKSSSATRHSRCRRK